MLADETNQDLAKDFQNNVYNKVKFELNDQFLDILQLLSSPLGIK